MKKERLVYLDVIRTLAVICVFINHYCKQFPYYGIDAGGYQILPDYIFSTYLGGYGVSLFFIISGASLMYVYQERCDLWTYTKKRFWGIFPMYWLAFGLAYLYNFYFVNKGLLFACPKWTILLTVFGMDGYLNWFTPSFYVLGEWFLGCIILLYVIFPILRIGVLKKPVLTAVIAGAVYVLCVVFFHTAMPTNCLFLVRVPEFLVGMYFMRYFRKVNWKVALGSAAVLVFFAVFDFSQAPSEFVAPPVGVASFFVLVFVSKYIDCRLVRSITQTVGKYCFPIFLVHHFVIQKVMLRFYCTKLRVSEVWMLFLCCALATAVAAWLLYKFDALLAGNLRKCITRDKVKEK